MREAGLFAYASSLGPAWTPVSRRRAMLVSGRFLGILRVAADVPLAHLHQEEKDPAHPRRSGQQPPASAHDHSLALDRGARAARGHFGGVARPRLLRADRRLP